MYTVTKNEVEKKKDMKSCITKEEKFSAISEVSIMWGLVFE